MLTLTEALRELYFWKFNPSDNFHSLLFTLIAKADLDNRKSLALAFPAEVLAWNMWQESPDEDEFFKLHSPMALEK